MRHRHGGKLWNQKRGSDEGGVGRPMEGVGMADKTASFFKDSDFSEHKSWIRPSGNARLWLW